MDASKLRVKAGSSQQVETRSIAVPGRSAGPRTSKGSWHSGHRPADALASSALCACSAALLDVGE